MKQVMKQRKSIGRSVKLLMPHRTRRVILVAALLALTLTLSVLVWAKPMVVKRYLGWGAAQPQQSDVSLTLRSNGFDPTKIQRNAGAFTLSISNQTSASTVTLHLYKSNGERVREIIVGSQWSDALDLTNGAYTLVDPTNPARTCTITIE